jgi:hypothetical protein
MGAKQVNSKIIKQESNKDIIIKKIFRQNTLFSILSDINDEFDSSENSISDSEIGSHKVVKDPLQDSNRLGVLEVP